MHSIVIALIALTCFLGGAFACGDFSHKHTVTEEGNVVCNLMLDEAAPVMGGRPSLMPGIDYERESRLVASALEKNNKVFSAGVLTLNFDSSVSASTQTAVSFAAQLLSYNFDFAVNYTIPVSVSESLLSSSSLLAQATSTTNDSSSFCYIGQRNSFAVVGASSLYRYLNGKPCNASKGDIVVTVNSDSSIQWYKGTSGSPGVSQIDMVTVAMHELCHGLGFFSAIGLSGSVYSNTQASACKQGGVGQCSTYYDSMLVRQTSPVTVWQPNGSSTFLGNFFTNNDLFITPFGVSSQYTKIHSVSTFTPGTSGSHWAPDLPTPAQCLPGDVNNPLDPASVANFVNCNGLMKGQISRGIAVHIIGANTASTFSSMGYPVRNCSSFVSCGQCLQVGCEWCFTDNFCGDRSDGKTTCSKSYQWVSTNSKCTTGNLVCTIPSISVPTNINQLLDPATLSLQCPSSTLEWLL